MDKPHILILMSDQHRADTLSCAGHPTIRTPNLDSLAAEGIRFANACTVSPLCMPARASFINGLYPHNHHMWDNAGQMPPDDETFFQLLQQQGYYVAYIGKSHYYEHGPFHMRDREPYMHARGIDYVHETTGPWATQRTDSYMTDHWAARGLLELFRQDYRQRRQAGPLLVRPSPLPADEFLDSYIGRQAVEFINGYDRAQPLCLFVGFGGPHEPWDAPEPYASLYQPERCPAAIAATPPAPHAPAQIAQWLSARRLPHMTEADIARIRANYYGKITLVDHWCGQILEACRQRGLSDDMFVVFWSDHGEMAGDHAALFKTQFYESALRIPLIMAWPGKLPAGATSQALVETVDIMPTVLEAIGAAGSGRALGRSFLACLHDAARAHRQDVLSEVNQKGIRTVMLRSQRYKYAVRDDGQGFMLFDLADDHHEQHNLIGCTDTRSLEAELRDRLFRRLLAAEYSLPRSG